MKKIIICAVLLFLSDSLFSQQNNLTQPLNHQDYLQKSKNQKAGAWVLLGGGTAVLAITAISAASSIDFSGPKKSFPVIPVSIGGAMILSSVPLFIASVRNKKRSIEASAYFKIDKAQIIKQGGIGFYSFPAIALKLSLQ
ncbi:MAG TPA: hypothetical protein VFX43_04960 [Chitinophagaceae bacterium]|nr:hypothetical protein [Chitinophagaceae bacterium]